LRQPARGHRQAASVPERRSQKELDLAVETPQIVRRPGAKKVGNLRVESEEERLAVHVEFGARC
jgi:hypothetical protein